MDLDPSELKVHQMEAVPVQQIQQIEPVGENEQNPWEVEKAQLEQLNFNLNQELADARERLQDISRKNAQIVEQLGKHDADLAESIKFRRSLEAVRNDLTEKNIGLEITVSRLKIEKEERDTALTNVNKEKQSALVEMFALKDQIKQLSDEKTNLTLSLEQYRQENRSIIFEREKHINEQNLFADTKKWLMNEVSERDNKISSLRMELGYKDIQLVNEKFHLESELSSLKVQIENLQNKLESSKKSNDEMSKRIEQIEVANIDQVSNLEAELRCHAELASVLKNTMEESKAAADSFRDELIAKDNVIKEIGVMLEEVQAEFEKDKTNFNSQLADKDEEILKLKNELLKSNELMKSKHALNVNATEDELAIMSPAAAETVRLLKGGNSLTAIVRDHAKVVGENAALRQENGSLMNSLEELIGTLNENRPAFDAQNNLNNSMLERNEKYEEQLVEAEKATQTLINQRDAAQRELAFTQAELEKYQREYDVVMKRNAELMYAIERQNRAGDPNWDQSQDERMFTTIVSLQQRNIQLESDIENEKKSAAQAAMNAQNAEMTELRAALSKSQEAETRLKSQIEQLKSALHVVQEQGDCLKNLVRDSVSATEARNARIKAEEANAAKIALEMKVKRLEDFVETVKTDSANKEKTLNQKLEAAEANAISTKQTSVTLEVMLESQKRNTDLLQDAIKSCEKETEVAKKELEKVLTADSQKAQKLVEIGKEAMDASAALGQLRVQYGCLKNDFDSAKSEINHLRAENNSQRAVLQREQHLAMSINEMATRLARVESEKMNYSTSQMEVLRLERDSLKTSSSRLFDQVTHLKNEAKIQQRKLEQELEAMKVRLVEKESQFNASEMELIELRSKLASVQAQYTGAEMTGMTQDRLKKEYVQLKNRTQFLENQIDELKQKLLQAETEKSKRDNENALVESHSNVLEETLKQTEKMGNLERERLESKVKSHENRSQLLSDQLAAIREEYENMKMSYEDSKFESEKDISELRRQLDVYKVQMESVQQQNFEASEAVSKAKLDVSEKEELARETANQLQEAKEQLLNNETLIALLQSRLNEKSSLLVAETDAKTQADEMRQIAETALQRKIAEKDQLEADARGKLNEYEQKLDQLSHEYEAFSATISDQQNSSMSTSMVVDSNESFSGLADVSRLSQVDTGFVESLQKMLHFVRKDKDAAVSRAMSAEIEMRRLRAETTEFEIGRNALMAKIRDLETEQVQNAAKLVEKAKLAERVESLESVQNINQQLTSEKAKLTAIVQKLQQEKVVTDKKTGMITAKHNETVMKLNAQTQELNLKKKEVELLKKKVEESGKGSNASLQTQLDQAKALLTQSKQEAELASSQARVAEQAKIKAETAADQFRLKFTQTRQLAVKFRDELTDLKAKFSNGESSGTGAAQATTPAEVTILTAENEKLKKEIESLTEQIQKLSQKSSDADMNAIRMRMLESKMEKMTDKLGEITSERDGLMQKNIALSRQLDHSKAVSATDVESKSATSSQPDTPLEKKTPSAARGVQIGLSPSPFSPSNIPPMSTLARKQDNADHTASVVKLTPLQKSAFSGVKGQNPSVTSSPNPIPPAPAVTQSASLSSTTEHPKQRTTFAPSSIPNEPIDVIPPVPSENVPDPAPPSSSTFGGILPVPQTFQTSARVPTQTLFPQTSSSNNEVTARTPDVQKKSMLPNIAEPTASAGNVTYSFATSTLPRGQQLFGKSSVPTQAISTTTSAVSSESLVLPEESVAEAAEQSSLVSGSVDGSNEKTLAADLSANDGESRDSTATGGAMVSSSDGRRKRAATNETVSDAKRQRDSPNEAVTSSETQQQRHEADIPELESDDDEDVIIGMEQEVSDEDPNETGAGRREHVSLENDEEVLEDEMEGEEEEEEDDQSFGNDEEYEDEGEDQIVALNQADDVIVLSDDEDDADTLNEDNDQEEEEEEEEDDEDESGQIRHDEDDIIEVIGGEDSQPSLDDQDREAASAVEEAEDEGRGPIAPIDEGLMAPADPTGAAGIGSSGEEHQRVRMPPGLLNREAEREDQCSSSNEGSSAPAGSGVGGQRNVARMMRGTMKPARGIYQPRRGGGPGGPSGQGGSGTT